MTEFGRLTALVPSIWAPNTNQEELPMTPTRTSSPRATLPVNANLNRRLMAYAASASAAGVGLLAAPQVAEGKIVCTPTNVSIGVSGSLSIDLNNDGTPDFEVVELFCGSRSGCLFVNPLVVGNGIRGSRLGALAGGYGVPVGPLGQFLSQFGRINSTESAVAFMVQWGCYAGESCFSGGPWANSTNKYLGFKFLIDGKVHYGWARMSVKVLKGSVVLTGYAYETIPNHKILEGYTQGLTVGDLPPTDLLAPAPQLASLGTLACGTDGLSLWRREEEEAAVDNTKNWTA
jgi:hypothetical protein